ncbi:MULTISPECIES: cytochrome P450 [unclassified Lysobacter]|uniref:cytochrome P450 n=1 Tax=unclassified Lysobacter TaxID=2635362 RepID=UPI001BE7AF11|nr:MULTISPECIES: cytochrome P450 [unclassified Lysobacter]MBT2750058.1 cytochrome P450 [Lysobacter sp. ISL-50]MBT2775370.1 cytochrome P450 [Lysobacter sp. ISL-54]MBT2783493.1 cytochrome P450 [Lysobacter sp. ISL-52]
MDIAIQALTAQLQAHAQRQPDKETFTFLGLDGAKVESLSYAELDRRARHIAAMLQDHDAGGKRVVLLFPPGLDFTVAFYACLYAGAIAVPAYPPDPARLDRTLPRLRAIAADVDPAIVLTSVMTQAAAKHVSTLAPELAAATWLGVNEPIASNASAYRPVVPAPGDVALIQYTSGSTAAPKGVMVSHYNILANAQMYQQVASWNTERVIVSWAPTYHDLGLMAGVVLPVALDAPVVQISPLDFLRRPALWLQAIQRYGGTDTNAPNFALDLCSRKISDQERRALNLSSLRICLVAAEPVRHATLERFAHRFSPSGLKRNALFPAYGLAEAVAGVSCNPRGGWRTTYVDVDELSRHRFVEVESDHANATVPMIASGEPCVDVTVAIIDPDTRLPAAPSTIGEIWIDGPNVALGYWRREADSREIFAAERADAPGRRMLRTGDLGYLHDGQLFVTGRLKDLIIVRGRNYYPQDIELSVELSHPRIRPGATIAFAVEREGIECPIVVAEIDFRLLHEDAEKKAASLEILAAIRGALAEQLGLQLHGLVLIGARNLDKTSSGKVARQACKIRYLQGQLESEFVWHLGLPATASANGTKRSTTGESSGDLTAYLRGKLGPAVDAILPGPCETSLLDRLGMDSLAVTELATDLEHDFHIHLPIPSLLAATSFDEVLTLLRKAIARRADVPSTAASINRSAIDLQALNAPTPLFCVGGMFGPVTYLLPLARTLGQTQPLIGLQPPGLDGHEVPMRSVEELARHYLTAIRAIQASGPYLLAGHSFGGLVAYEIARQLREQGERIAQLFLIDSSAVAGDDSNAPLSELMALYELAVVSSQAAGRPRDLMPLLTLPAEEQRAALLRALLGQEVLFPGSSADSLLATFMASNDAMIRYRPSVYAGAVTLFRAGGGLPRGMLHPDRQLRLHFADATLGWAPHCPALRIVDLPGDHVTVVQPPHVAALADAIRRAIPPASVPIEAHRLSTASSAPNAGRAISIGKSGVQFDPLHEAFIENPHPFLDQLREHDPVHWNAAMSAWWITRYADVSAGLRDKRFSVDSRNGSPQASGDLPVLQNDQEHWSPLSQEHRARNDTALTRFYNNNMLFLDPPTHTRLRRCFAPLFDPSSMKNLAPHIDEIIEALVAEMRLRRDPELIRDLALALPVRLLSSMFGIPDGDVPTLVEWGRVLSRGFYPIASAEAVGQIINAADRLMSYLAEHIRKQRGVGAGDHLLAHMLSQHDESGLPLSDEEIVANCTLMFSAGLETTPAAIGNAALALLRHPDQLSLLREHPEFAENAVDEMLRYEGPVITTYRTALEDVEIGGKRIRRGDTIAFCPAAANRDPSMFAEPHRLDLARDSKAHVAFSHGVHYCIGAPLARLEMHAFLRAMSQQHIELEPDGIRWRPSTVFRRLERLRIRLLS